MNVIELLNENFLLEKQVGNSLLLLDIDDTLLTAQNIFIYRKLSTDKAEVRLTPEQYAKDPASTVKSNKQYYDYREFRNADKVAQSIKTGLPIVPNLKEMDRYIQRGWKIGILTARGMEDVIAKTMQEWLKIRNKKGELVDVDLPRRLVNAINDDNKHYPGATDFEKKTNVIKKLSKKFNQIIFVDDDIKNVKAVKNMVKEEGIKNVMVKFATAKPGDK
jgi:2-hydroxy-3-keto-5-methylthiopentenyl-1-phosphate phosphatase